MRVVRGRPSAEELAAALIVIHTLALARTSRAGSGAGPAEASAAPGAHIRPHRLTGPRGALALPRGPGAWRRSGWL
ncbi:acyl-CoA carboxylase epsilon subunit [Streptomyces sp. NPDC006668]|uniref:acyl-CoA carboxylase epsilon subunit n=1 Tax=Streptomyces sp. NPDC006668 TaxID=3156903 RepID=UPI003411E6C2